VGDWVVAAGSAAAAAAQNIASARHPVLKFKVGHPGI
jgi:hypothetical protein